jgi:hypothetical protein
VKSKNEFLSERFLKSVSLRSLRTLREKKVHAELAKSAKELKASDAFFDSGKSRRVRTKFQSPFTAQWLFISQLPFTIYFSLFLKNYSPFTK